MNIVYVHQYFLTPRQGGAVRSYHLAKGLVDAGAQVDVITAHNQAHYDIQWVDGIRVHYLPVSYKNEYSFIKRVIAFLTFVRQSKRLLQKLARPDLLYITSTPLTTGLIGIWAKRRLAVPFFFEVRDLWPEAPIQMGIVNHPILKSLLYRMERRIYQEAIHLVALSPGIREALVRACPGKAVSYIPNFVDTSFFQTSERSLTDHSDGSLPRKPLTISYVGAIGRVNGLSAFLDLAEEVLKAGKHWRFVLMGKGASLPHLYEVVRAKGLTNVEFRPFGNKRAVREQLARSDFAYLSFLPLPVLESSSPNKFFDALAMGVPIVVNFKGWIADLVQQHEIGVLQGNPLWRTVQQIEALYQHPTEWKSASQQARELAERQFSKEKAVSVLCSLLLQANSPGKMASGAYNRIA
ncbi:MAG: glycosyltransferase family 4 protein [Lunatimonas sp.]|uniref:glycosyltransferase family 4 protein n=1 Tax=Lunatimonas sp. TaxID=2060141 RepID=UPI00263A7659|nr:glycosyltransferase family 4 protein [Lunatimonas sp.]MCC5938456.1 glycosyltransferase family 4 protein [Lunatimonas sp.]